MEPLYNKVLGTMKITLLYQVSHYHNIIKVYLLYTNVTVFIFTCFVLFVCFEINQLFLIDTGDVPSQVICHLNGNYNNNVSSTGVNVSPPPLLWWVITCTKYTPTFCVCVCVCVSVSQGRI